MVQNGCDLLTIQQVMRHNHITTKTQYLHLADERKRYKLEREGLFDQDREKPIPRLPRKISVVTSKDSAAINDIRTVVDARFPKMNLVMAYVTLQGNCAAGHIIQAINRFSEIVDVDGIILARGGGPSRPSRVTASLLRLWILSLSSLALCLPLVL